MDPWPIIVIKRAPDSHTVKIASVEYCIESGNQTENRTPHSNQTGTGAYPDIYYGIESLHIEYPEIESPHI